MYILKNPKGEVIASCNVKPNEDWEEATEEYGVGVDGRIYSKTEMSMQEYSVKKDKCLETRQKDDLRVKRAEVCFPVINRGALWYDKLTEEQKAELSVWYQAWLDAPETGIIPTAPTWLEVVSTQKIAE